MITSNRRYILFILSFYILAYILPLGALDLFSPDETRYAEIPNEMIDTGDWVVPHIDGVRYFEKPVMGYWVHAASILILGENNFAVRFPSAFSVGLSALLIYLMVRRATYRSNEDKNYMAHLSALIFLSCFAVFGIGTIAVLDSLFSFFLTASITSFYFACEESPGSGKEKIFLIISGIACGLAFLTKGFLAFVLPVLTFVPYLVWERRYRDLIRMSWLPVLAAFLTALPWSILIYQREPDFWKFFFWNEHIRRFMAENAQHKKPFWYFFMAAPVMFIPWTFLIPSAVAGLKTLINNDSLQGRLVRLSICWLVLPFLFFSFSGGKLITYILPCFPPFAILMYFGLLNILEKSRYKFFQWGFSGIGIFFSLILLAFAYVQFRGYRDFHLFGNFWKAILFAGCLIFSIILCFWSNKCLKRLIK